MGSGMPGWSAAEQVAQPFFQLIGAADLFVLASQPLQLDLIDRAELVRRAAEQIAAVPPAAGVLVECVAAEHPLERFAGPLDQVKGVEADRGVRQPVGGGGD